MKNLAIIGASYLQAPLINKAKEMGMKTHVFAWAANDVGEKIADVFYPISIVEKERILEKCREIGIDGICSIASDLAAITVNYVAQEMNLVGNSMECTLQSTNKHSMRLCFERNGDPSPKSLYVSSVEDLKNVNLSYPVIVKPLDRSGSRGITKLEKRKGLAEAIETAKNQGFEKAALVEEFAEGQEYSVEFISWKGKHEFLALTHKFTSGAPHFVETGHLEPAPVDEETKERVIEITRHALTSLGIRYGASHTELKISGSGKIQLIEIGGRMGGDFIGSTLVEISTGFDFVENVIRIAVGEEPHIVTGKRNAAAVRFIFNENDIRIFNRLQKEHPEFIVDSDIHEIGNGEITESAARYGYFIMKAPAVNDLIPYLPDTL